MLMTSDDYCIGVIFGISFIGKWVLAMKDYVDKNFMKLFDPNYLFNDYANKGCAEPIVINELFDDEALRLEYEIGHIKRKVADMDAVEAGHLLSCGIDETDFKERYLILKRMHFDRAFEE